MTIGMVAPEYGVRPGPLGFLECTDMFCGAGGSSLGLEHVPGLVVTQCINHDALAIEAHNLNFPNADHDKQDIDSVPAKRFRRTPILWASPSCTHHAFCRGERTDDDEALRSRATMWDVPRFTEYHGYDAIIVENVVEARLWCDDHTKCNCGATFNQWFAEMTKLGYEGQIVYFNSQFALPTPQSRDRMYVVFWKKGARKPQLNFRPTAWCTDCKEIVRGIQTFKVPGKTGLRSKPGMYEWGRYGAQYVYTCPNEGCGAAVAPAVIGARAAIDFSIPSERIGDRTYKNGKPKPLKPKTRTRIKVGLENLGRTQPIQVQVGGNLYERNGAARVWSLDMPLRTITTTNTMAMVVPGKSDSVPASDDAPAPSVTTRSHLGLVVRAGGLGGVGRGTEEPMGAVVGSDRQIALVLPAGGNLVEPRVDGVPMPTVVGSDRLSVVVANREHSVAREPGEPMHPITTAPMQHMLVQVNRGDKGGPDPSRTRRIDEVLPTVAGHGEMAIVSMRNHGDASTVARPMQTVVGGGMHHGLLVYNGTPGFVRDVGDAAGTVTSRDKQSLLVPYFSNGKAYPDGEPLHTLTGKDRSALVITEDFIDDCYFRMLKWPELLRAQHMHVMPDGTPYRLEAQRRNGRGKMVGLSDELRVRMIGNAVSSTVAAMLGTAVVEALAA
jgi:DNA (cytosine-5)-methyltransferase 1